MANKRTFHSYGQILSLVDLYLCGKRLYNKSIIGDNDEDFLENGLATIYYQKSDKYKLRPFLEVSASGQEWLSKIKEIQY